MSLPTGYLPRKGDILVLHAVAKHDVDAADDRVFLQINGHYGTENVELAKVVGLHCRKWNEGEKVRNIHDYGDIGEVVAVYEDRAWVKLQSGSMKTFDANALEAMPEDVPIVVPPPAPPSQDIKNAEI